MLVKILVIVGLLVAAAAAFSHSSILPWLVGGTGLLTGLIVWKQGVKGMFIASIGLVVCLSAIREQPFNPQWLTQTVFFVRVYFAHVGLAAGALHVLASREIGMI